MNLREKIIVALDFPDFDSCVSMVETLGEEISFYKIGLEMLASGDYFKMVRYLKNNNKRVFADLKLYDIPTTIGRAVKNLTQYDLDLLTIHASNSEIMNEAASNKRSTKILAVTALTCLEKNDLDKMGFDKNLSLDELVLKKADLALKSNIDGVVASPLETRLLRQNLGKNFLIATPGIRLEDGDDDQKRTSSPSSAIKNGANYLVIGRPITKNQDPKSAVKKLIA